MSIGLRLVLVFSMPVLSDDFYRFIWDGQVTLSGANPFLHYPHEYMIDREIFPLLNSPQYYTVYPPMCQLIFLASAGIGGGDIYFSAVVMKVFILLFEVGSIFIIRDLLDRENKKTSHVLLYALNPLIICEFFGGLHFESAMIFFVLLAVWLLSRFKGTKGLVLSGLSFAVAICTKLWPVLFLPLLIRRIGWKRSIVYGLVTMVFVALMFAPFWDEHLFPNIGESLAKYFNYFEFNASFYNLLRYFDPSNPAFTSTILRIMTGLGFVLFYLWYDKSERNFFELCLFLLLVYFLTATTIHPWYITPLMAFAVFTPWRFVYLWSFLVVGTYSAYISHPPDELEWVLNLEYFAVLGCLVYDIKFRKAHQVQL